MTNPYKELGSFEPFALFGLQSMVFEAFKKVTCAGIAGRVKSEKKDIEEAIYTLRRAVIQCEEIEEDFAAMWWLNDIEAIINHYRAVFGESKRLDAARHILLFCQTNNPGHLKDAIVILEHV